MPRSTPPRYPSETGAAPLDAIVKRAQLVIEADGGLVIAPVIIGERGERTLARPPAAAAIADGEGINDDALGARRQQALGKVV